MNRIVFDIEANGLTEVILNSKGQVTKEADTVHCMVMQNIDTGEFKEYGPCEIEDGIKELREADLLIGHNIMMYDVPLLERLYGTIQTKVLDTLIVSKLMYPDKSQHPLNGNSLECWGIHLGFPKLDYDGGWEAFSEQMLTYCKGDVALNKLIFEEQQSFIKENHKVIRFEHIVSKIIAEQTMNGFSFDLHKGKELLLELDTQTEEIRQDLKEIFPPLVEERVSEKTGNRLKDKITIFNPGSRKQIAERLYTKYGWKAPQTEKGNPKVDEAVLKKLKFPEAKRLVEYFYSIKLMGQVTDWVARASNSRDGKIHGSINPQGTVTGRMTASQPNLQQVSGDKRARALFIPREGWVQVGIDAQGLEARMLANRMYPYDRGGYAKIVLEKDIHDENQRLAGLPSRNAAKTFFYGFIYGAGDAKIGKIVGQSAAVGKNLKKKFLQKLPALNKVIQNCKFQVNKSGTISLLDGRQVPCRSIHAALNVQLQGDGAVIMKLAQCILDREIKKQGYNDRAKFMATVHDEWQLEVDPSIADTIGLLGCESIRQAGERLDCKIKLEGDFRVGRNWSECH
mgnify:CR=1 FL=1